MIFKVMGYALNQFIHMRCHPNISRQTCLWLKTSSWQCLTFLSITVSLNELYKGVNENNFGQSLLKDIELYLKKKCCVSWAWLSDHHWGKVEKLCFNLDIGKVEREGSQMQFNYPPTKKTTWCLEVININNRLATAGWMFRVLSSDLYHPSKAKHCNCRVLKHPTVSHNSLPKKTCNLTRR